MSFERSLQDAHPAFPSQDTLWRVDWCRKRNEAASEAASAAHSWSLSDRYNFPTCPTPLWNVCAESAWVVNPSKDRCVIGKAQTPTNKDHRYLAIRPEKDLIFLDKTRPTPEFVATQRQVSPLLRAQGRGTRCHQSRHRLSSWEYAKIGNTTRDLEIPELEILGCEDLEKPWSVGNTVYTDPIFDQGLE